VGVDCGGFETVDSGGVVEGTVGGGECETGEGEEEGEDVSVAGLFV
jgi:hypothetical protein